MSNFNKRMSNFALFSCMYEHQPKNATLGFMIFNGRPLDVVTPTT